MDLLDIWRFCKLSPDFEFEFRRKFLLNFLADRDVTAGITHVYLGLEDFPKSVAPQKVIEELRYRVEKNPEECCHHSKPSGKNPANHCGKNLFALTGHQASGRGLWQYQSDMGRI
jgi:hypothetical protein